MAEDHVLPIEGGPTIPLVELTFRATRSGGPGGQHVNTSATRVELTWDVAASSALTEEQRARILARLRNRIDERGVLRIVESRSRSQHRNRTVATERLARIVAGALRERKRRRPTRPPKSAKEARLREKRHRSETKSRRGPVTPEE